MIPVEKKPHTAPVLFARCPVHHQLVGADGDGRLLGHCAGCMNDASLAIRIIERGRV